MPRYDFGCRSCELRWEVVKLMSEISDHTEHCPKCNAHSEQLYDEVTGMIRVREGASPTRFGDGSWKSSMTAEDKGFMKEFESIWEQGGGMEQPSTGEKYQLLDDEGGSGPYAGLESEKEKFRKAREEVDASGTMPSRKAQEGMKQNYINSSLKRSRDKLRQWPAARKGRKS